MSARVLLTGGAGFIGSHLARALLGAGYEVDVVDNLSSGKRENLPAGFELIEADLGHEDALTLLPDRDYVAILHLAGQSSGERSFHNPIYDFDANARSTLLLAYWALERGIPAFIHASSMGIYGQPDKSPVAEDARTRPLSWYGASKLAAEKSLEIAGQNGLRTCSMRMFNVYGAGQNLEDMRQGMASIYLAFILRGDPVVVKGSLDRIRDLVHVDDVVRAWRSALESNADGAFNVGTGRPTTVRDLVRRLTQLCGHADDYSVIQGDATPGDQFAITADITRIRSVLGWEPEVSLDEGLASMVAWARG